MEPTSRASGGGRRGSHRIVPYADWIFRLTGTVAHWYAGYGDPADLPFDFVVYAALQAKADYHAELSDRLTLSMAQHLKRHDFDAYAGRLALVASGPGRLVRWEETLSEKQRAGLAWIEQQQAETIARRTKNRKMAGHPSDTPKPFNGQPTLRDVLSRRVQIGRKVNPKGQG